MTETPRFSLNQRDWELHRQGPADQARHSEKIKDAIRNNLHEIVGEEALIMSDGKTTVRVPIRGLELPRFRHDPNKTKGVGAGSGKPGDVITEGDRAWGHGKGRGAGNQPGIDYFEAEITLDELAKMVFEDLGLPNLRPKRRDEITTEDVKFTDIGRRGIMSNLDKRRSVLESIRRKARAGQPRRFEGILPEDQRFRTWTPSIRKESNAVVFAMRDVSGSMGEFEKYITRSSCWWILRFLRTRYENVKIVFITHHTEAQEVDEYKFFALGESGGTKISSAYQLAHETAKQRFDPESWNTYYLHFSDGDNWEDDNGRCVELVGEILKTCSLFGYAEIADSPQRPSANSTLLTAFRQVTDSKFVPSVIADKTDVLPTIRRFFPGEKILEGSVSRA